MLELESLGHEKSFEDFIKKSQNPKIEKQARFEELAKLFENYWRNHIIISLNGKKTSARSVESALEDIPRDKTTFKKLKISFTCYLFKISGMSQRLTEANFNQERKCAAQTCLNNTALQPSQFIQPKSKTTSLSNQPATNT